MVWHPNHDQIMFKKYQKYKIIESSKIPKKCLCLPSGTNLVTRAQKLHQH